MTGSNGKRILTEVGRALLIFFLLPFGMIIALLSSLLDFIFGQTTHAAYFSPPMKNFRLIALMNVLQLLLYALCFPLFILTFLIDMFLPEEKSLTHRIDSVIGYFSPKSSYETPLPKQQQLSLLVTSQKLKEKKDPLVGKNQAKA